MSGKSSQRSISSRSSHISKTDAKDLHRRNDVAFTKQISKHFLRVPTDSSSNLTKIQVAQSGSCRVVIPEGIKSEWVKQNDKWPSHGIKKCSLKHSSTSIHARRRSRKVLRLCYKSHRQAVRCYRLVQINVERDWNIFSCLKYTVYNTRLSLKPLRIYIHFKHLEPRYQS